MKTLLALFLALSATHAAATEFTVSVPDKSNISFVSRQMGVAVNGSFSKFTSQIDFNPARPEAGRAQIEVMLASVNAGSSDANDEVKDKSWFDVKTYPTANFVSTGIKALGANKYQASGKLTIKGKSRDVLVPFNVKSAGNTLVLDGTIPISRSQFGIGAGEWADPSVVADEVQIRFNLTVAPARP